MSEALGFYSIVTILTRRTQVEDTHFKIPTMILEGESEVFKAMFTLPPSPGEEVEGQSDDKPILLEGVKKDEFRSLLRLLYPR